MAPLSTNLIGTYKLTDCDKHGCATNK